MAFKQGKGPQSMAEVHTARPNADRVRWIRAAGPQLALVMIALGMLGRPAVAQPPQPQAVPAAPTTPARPAPAPAPVPVPKPAAPAATPPAATPPVPAIPEPAAGVPNLAQDFADLDVGGLREAWSNTPSFVGDGCAPTSTSSSLAVGRLLVIAPGLYNASGTLQGNQPAQINTVTDGSYNSVQAIKAAGYPAFILPAQSLGNVPGTPPVNLTVGGPSPGAGITPVQSPASFTAAVDNTFATNPNLDNRHA